MKQIHYTLKLALAVGLALVLLVVAWLTQPEQAQPAAVQAGGGLALQRPAFLKAAHAAGLAQVDFDFLLEEAGVTAYTKLDQELDLVYLESYFRTIGQQTGQFISGIMIAPGYENLPEFGENAEIQVFLHRDGWIVAYLTKYQTASEIFDWVNYDEKRLKGSTLLENVVRMLALDTGVSDFNVLYYDFRYPEATNLMLAADHAEVSESFSINIPRGLTIYENSWSHAKFGGWDSPGFQYVLEPGECNLDNEKLSIITPTTESTWGLATAELVPTKLSLGTNHTFSIIGRNSRSYCGLAIVYREASK